MLLLGHAADYANAISNDPKFKLGKKCQGKKYFVESNSQPISEVIRERIARERDAFASETGGAGGEDYPRLIAEYEALQVDREFAEETYRAALAALDVARAKASRQSRYLATYIEPTLAESSEYPDRLLIELLSGLFLVLSWAVMVLVYYAIRDRD